MRVIPVFRHLFLHASFQFFSCHNRVFGLGRESSFSRWTFMLLHDNSWGSIQSIILGLVWVISYKLLWQSIARKPRSGFVIFLISTSICITVSALLECQYHFSLFSQRVMDQIMKTNGFCSFHCSYKFYSEMHLWVRIMNWQWIMFLCYKGPFTYSIFLSSDVCVRRPFAQLGHRSANVLVITFLLPQLSTVE